MTDDFRKRLNSIYERITTDDFLSGRGIGNEIAFFVFDYAPKHEMPVREHIRQLENRIRGSRRDIRLASVNLFAFLVDHLKDRGFLQHCFRLQQAKGNAHLLRALKGPLKPESVAQLLASKVAPERRDLVLLHGIGSAYPLLRTHALLSNLHRHMGRAPVVLFYPGTYVDGTLRLFGGRAQATDKHNYYRALRLIN